MAENTEQTIRILYHSNEIDHLTYVDGKSDWIDLRAAKEYRLKAGEFALIDLGVSVKLPEGYEMITAPRSSTFAGISFPSASFRTNSGRDRAFIRS